MDENSFIMRARPRRLRRLSLLRDAVSETYVRPQMLMQPYFVVPGSGITAPIAALPGIKRFAVDTLVAEVGQRLAQGLRQVLLFGVIADTEKDHTGMVAAGDDHVVAQAVRALKMQFGDDLLVATDVCLCGSLTHGHCGVLSSSNGDVDNDATLEPLTQMALNHAQAGADIIAPSDMMDGRIGHIRQAFERQGFHNTVIMSYSSKYASAYYGPFREAAASKPHQGNRKSYQMDYRNSLEAVREMQLDVVEGADIIMVKPALAYLDVIARIKATTMLPVACYSVGGEYAMVKAAAQAGWIDEHQVVCENLTAMARAGAQLIISYHAAQVLEAQWL